MKAALVLCSALAAALALPGAARAAAPDPRVAQLLRTSGAALGGAALARHPVLRLDGKVNAAGLSGTGTQWLHIGDVRFAESFVTAPVAGGDGYDGHVVWDSDQSGLVWVDGGGAGRAQEISSAFVNNEALWSPHQGGATVTWGGTKTLAGHAYDSLVVTAPGSAIPFEMWFDRRSHLPVRTVQAVGPIVSFTTLADYHRVAGIMIPYHTHSDTNQGNPSDTVLTSVAVNPPGAAANLAKPPSHAHDFSITGGASSTTIPFDLVENHVYLDVMLNGKGPYRFIYDTGGANIVDPAVAQEIGANSKGSAQGGGVGATTESVSFANVSTLTIGNAVLKDQLFGVAPVRMGFGVSGGRPVDGLIGFEVLSRFITTFDYADHTVVLALPGTATTPPSAAVVPFVLDGRQPLFACTIDRIASLCSLDTGARDSISLFTPWLAAHPQALPATLTAPGVSGFGFGGSVSGRLGRLTSLGIGTFELHQIVGDFSTATAGAFAAPFTAANVGGNLLRRFNLVLDYGAQTMALTPNAAFNEPDVYERAGLFLLNRAGAKVVYDVRPGTPAAAAGIVKGDVIVSADGKDAAAMSLEDVRKLFFGAPGTVLHLVLTAKDGSTKTALLTLQDYV